MAKKAKKAKATKVRLTKKGKTRIAELKKEPAPSTRTKSGLLRKTAYFTPEEWQAIREVALEANVTYAEVIRHAVREYFGLRPLP